MQYTKSAEELQARRNKVSQWNREGKVMTDATRKRIRDERKRLQELEDKAEMIIAGLNTSNKPKSKKTTVNNSNFSEGSVRSLSRNTKSDDLAMKASQIIQEILQ